MRQAKGIQLAGNTKPKWGFLRETKEKAQKAGIDVDTGMHRNGLDEYLAVIFPSVNDWIHDKSFASKRPDFRSPSLKLIVEFDGLQHYTDPRKILQDQKNTEIYEKNGYKVVRIPSFIQLSNAVVKQLFGVDIHEPLFDESYPSMGIGGNNTPAFLCHAGVDRMAHEFKQFPKQYEVNLKALKSMQNEFLSGASLLISAYKKAK